MTGAIFFITPPALLKRDRSTKIDASSVATYRSRKTLAPRRCIPQRWNLNDGKMYREHFNKAPGKIRALYDGRIDRVIHEECCDISYCETDT